MHGVGGDEAGKEREGMERTSGQAEPDEPMNDPASIFGDFTEDEEEEDADEGPDEIPVKIPREPGDPTPKEFEEHCVTHLPHRPNTFRLRA